jgi:hypothetical protein
MLVLNVDSAVPDIILSISIGVSHTSLGGCDEIYQEASALQDVAQSSGGGGVRRASGSGSVLLRGV